MKVKMYSKEYDLVRTLTNVKSVKYLFEDSYNDFEVVYKNGCYDTWSNWLIIDVEVED